MNHDCYPPKILCKLDVIFIGFYIVKIVKNFWLEENSKVFPLAVLYIYYPPSHPAHLRLF